MSSTQPDLPAWNHGASYRKVQRPDPGWKPGDGLGNTESARAWRKDEEMGWKTVHPNQTDSSELYAIMTTGIVPRPIAFVSSISSKGTYNLAPFSWFNMVSNTPPLIMFSARPQNGREKDTAINVRESGEFTCNMISDPWADAANFTSINCPSDVSEWTASGLRMEKSVAVKPPWVRESAFAMECVVHQIIDVAPANPNEAPSQPQLIILGLVKLIHVRNAVLDTKGYVDPGLYRPLIRLGRGGYAKLGEGFAVGMPRWEDHEGSVRELERRKGQGEEEGEKDS